MVGLELSDFVHAEAVVRRVFPPTPVLAAPNLSARVGAEIYLKLDCFTPIRTFKLRGALVKLQALADSGTTGGVITASAGNHGLAVARAARLYGRPAVVCVPRGANPQKVAAIQAEGARVVEHGDDYQAAYERSLELGRAGGLSQVHAYDDPHVIAGQGTLALELASAGDFDAVLVGVGGGGLVSGLAACGSYLNPAPRVFGIQPEGADSMIRSLAAGRVVELERVETVADGLAARKPGEWTLELTRRYVAGVLPVTDAELLEAMAVLLATERVVAEPAGVAGVAALLRYGAGRFGSRIAVVVSGANLSDEAFKRLLDLPPSGSGGSPTRRS